MGNVVLKDFDKLIKDTKENVNNNQDLINKEVFISRNFKAALAKWWENSGGKNVKKKRIEFTKCGFVMVNGDGQFTYAPNQTLVLASYAVDIFKEFTRFRELSEAILDYDGMLQYQASKTANSGKEPDHSEKLKKVYEELQKKDDPQLKETFEKSAREYMVENQFDENVINNNVKLLYDFVSQKWGKGLERKDSRDSVILSALNVVNANSGYIAGIVGAYVNEKTLADELPSMVSWDYEPFVSPHTQEKRFHNWHEQQLTPEGNFYSPNTIDTRIRAMDKGFRQFKENKDYDSVFQIQNAKELNYYIKALENDQKFAGFDKRNTYHCSQGLKTYLKYLQFLEENECGSGELCFATSLDNSMPRNQIIFGAPGTGKSYTLNKKREKLLGGDNETGYERVTFHPDYSYANFVGTYKPVPCKDSDDKDAITYEYVPGPFMRTYVKAMKNAINAQKFTEKAKPYLLIVEEINRADVAAVFGDVFQLLDRDEDNISQYPIETSDDMRKYLSEELDVDVKECGKIKIPDNMFIWATMNSADQGVFPMDTAFKRRWDFEYIGIDDAVENEEKNGVKDGIGNLVINLKLSGKEGPVQTFKWNDLRVKINGFLAENNINEDKQLGPYFISRKTLDSKTEIDGIEYNIAFQNAFKDKVIMYLYEDAAKQKRSDLFGSGIHGIRYSEICHAFDEDGINIFKHGLGNDAIENIKIR